MNQFIAEGEKGQTVLGLILEPGNLHLLREGHPVVKRVEDFFPDGIPRKLELAIFYSETPIADAKQIAAMSKMTFDERGPANKERKPHCPECKSTIEQLAVWRNESPMALTFCPQCGCIFGMVPSEVIRSFSTSNLTTK